jgi:hypothetical protein
MQRYAIVLAVLATVVTWLIPVGSGVGDGHDPETMATSLEAERSTLPVSHDA